jgi:PAS domain S-box-containing protein
MSPKENEKERRASESTQGGAFDAISAHICVLDENGVIIQTNRAWNQFAASNPPASKNHYIGENYLTICDRAKGKNANEAGAVAKGIRAVMSGKAEAFHLEYPCHSTTTKRWFIIRAAHFTEDGATRIVITHENITERRLIEEKLRAAERKYHIVADNTSDWEFWLSPRKKSIYMSPSCEGITGYAHREFIKDPDLFERIIHPDDLPHYKEHMREIDKKVVSVHRFEFRIQHRDGSMKWMEHTCRPIFDEDKKFLGVRGSHRDITERKEIEREILRSNERFAELVNNIPDIFWVADPVLGKSNFVSPAFEKIIGISYEKLQEIPGGFSSLVLPEDRYILLKSYEQEERGEPTDIQYRIRKPDGSIRWLQDKSTPIKDKNGNVTRVVGFANDITEQVEAKIRMQESELRFRQMAENIHEIFWIFDRQSHKHIYANPAYEAAFEVNEEILINDPDVFASRVIPDDQLIVHQALEKQKRGEHTEVEYRVCHSNGSIQWLWDRSFPIHDEKGNLIRTAGVATDITERKKSENNINRLVYDLKERVKELTALHNASRIFIDTAEAESKVLGKLVNILPSAWQYPEITAARIAYDGREYKTENFSPTPWMQRESFSLPDGNTCVIEIAYLKEKPAEYEGPFLKEERYLLEALAERAKTFLTRKIMDQRIARNNLELNQLLEAGRALSDALTPQQIYASIYHYLKAVMPCEMLVVSSFDPDTEMIACEFLQTSEGAQDVSGFPLIPLEPPGHGTQSLVLRSGKSMLLSDYKKELATANNTYYFDESGNILEESEKDEEQVRSALIVPLIVNGKTSGALQIFSFKVNDLTEDHLRFAEALTFRVSAALSTVKMFAELEKRVKERTAEIETIRQRLELATQAAQLGVWDWNVQTGDLIWDKQMHIISKTDKNQFTGNIAFSLSHIHPEDSKQMQDSMQKLLNGASIQNIEYRIIKGDGSVGYLKTHGAILRDAENRIEHVIGVAQDVTQERLAEHALRESEETYRALFENAHDAIFLFDINYIFMRVNSRCEDLLGYSADEMLGRNSNEFILPSELQDADKKTEQLLAGEYLPPYERRFKRKDGTIIETEINLSLIRDENNRPKLIQSVVRNITERKKAEETLRRANLELERAMRMKDEFLASMSHELRTPLTGVLGLSEALQMGVYGLLNEKQQNAASNIEMSGRHLLELINDILDLSKIEAGKLDLQMQPCSLYEICQSSIHLIKGMASKKRQSINFTMNPTDENMIVRGDMRRLKQIFVNLLGNAVKFTQEGGALGVEVVADKETRLVNITVWDEGIGIKAEDTHRLFKPFIQLDSSLSRQHTGTGLGLALVKRLVDVHKGKITVESVPEKGSRFTVSLPRLPSDATQKRLNAMRTPAILSSPSTQTRTIMVVDDNQVNVDMLSDFLRLQKFTVVSCKNARDFLSHVAEVCPAVILMDIQMPEIDGLEAIRRLRAMPDKDVASIPVIAITALAMTGDRERCLEAGANAYMSKPLKLQELTQLIKQALEGKNS